MTKTLQRNIVEQPRVLSSLLLAAALAGLLTELFYGIIVPIIPALRTEYGIDAGQIGLLLATQAIAMSLFALPFGWLGDRLKRRWPLIGFGLLLLGVASYIVSHATDFQSFAIARLLQGTAAAAILPSILAAVSEITPPSHRGEVLGWITGAEGMGTVFGPLVGGVLFELLGVDRTFIAFGIFLAISALPLALIFRRSPMEQSVVDHSHPIAPAPHRPGTAFVGLIVLSLATSTMAILEVVGTLRLSDEIQITEFGLGILFLALGVIFGAMQPLVGRFTDQHGRWAPVVVGLLGLLTLLITAAFVRGWGFVWAILLMAPFVALIFAPVAPLIGDEAEVSHNFGRAYGIMHIAFALGYVIGPIVGGELLKFGGPALPMIVAALICAITLIGLLIWLRVAPLIPPPSPAFTPVREPSRRHR